MKSALIALSLVLFSFSALANDGGSAYLEVQGIDPQGVKPTHIGWDKPFISFYGNEAKEYAKTLPAPSTVALGMMSPEDRELFLANERQLSFFSNGWMMSVTCSGGELKMHEGEDVDPARSMYYVINAGPRGFRCDFSLVSKKAEDEPGDYLGDAFKFTPYDQEKMRCE